MKKGTEAQKYNDIMIMRKIIALLDDELEQVTQAIDHYNQTITTAIQTSKKNLDSLRPTIQL